MYLCYWMLLCKFLCSVLEVPIHRYSSIIVVETLPGRSKGMPMPQVKGCSQVILKVDVISLEYCMYQVPYWYWIPWRISHKDSCSIWAIQNATIGSVTFHILSDSLHCSKQVLAETIHNHYLYYFPMKPFSSVQHNLSDSYFSRTSTFSFRAIAPPWTLPIVWACITW